MGRIRWLLVGFLIGSVVWTVFTWPLPRHLFDGVPTSSRNIERGAVRAMMPSDQLQLMYHYWLFQEMLSLRTPWLHNVYEFNTGDDRERYWPSAYFFPFSLAYAVCAWIGGRAFGMNAVGWISIGLTVAFTWRLVRRLGPGDGVAWLAAVVAVLAPYRWVAQLGGSPGGYAMVYVPLLARGSDTAGRDRRPLGGMIAGGALLLACFGDVQVFYFCGLSLPFWFLLSGLLLPDAGSGVAPAGPAGPGMSWPRVRAEAGAWIKALAFLPVGILLALAYRTGMGAVLETSTMRGGRSLEEVALFSARWAGLFSWENLGVHNHVYVGYAACGLLAAGLVWLIAAGRRARRMLVVYGLILAAVVVVTALALGTNGPGDGLLLRAARKLIPHYDFVRQPARILCLLPTLLALAAAAAWRPIPAGYRATVAAATVLALFADYAGQVRATVCLLDEDQAAYRAVADDARRTGGVPRVLAAPLWPGDSDLSSLYQYYGSLYRIRLVNGYSPVVSQAYLEHIFRRFVSVNQGVLDDDQLNELRRRGIQYVVVHEDAFPEKVSPFPVATTLCRLLDHPRLELLTQAGPIWAFRVLTAPRTPPAPQDAYTYFPAPGYRDQELERQIHVGRVPLEEDHQASGGRFCVLNRDGAGVRLARPWYSGSARRLRWEVRVRGDGLLRVRNAGVAQVDDTTVLQVRSPDWQWRSLLVPPEGTFRPLHLDLSWAGGRVDVDRAFLSAGRWPILEPGRPYRIPASAFFHAGFSDLTTGAVYFRTRYEPHGAIFYGPLLPVAPGDYEAELIVQSAAPPGEALGELRFLQGNRSGRLCTVRAGRPAIGRFNAEDNLPLRLEFDYARTADLCLEEIILQRLPRGR